MVVCTAWWCGEETCVHAPVTMRATAPKWRIWGLDGAAGCDIGRNELGSFGGVFGRVRTRLEKLAGALYNEGMRSDTTAYFGDLDGGGRELQNRGQGCSTYQRYIGTHVTSCGQLIRIHCVQAGGCSRFPADTANGSLKLISTRAPCIQKSSKTCRAKSN